MSTEIAPGLRRAGGHIPGKYPFRPSISVTISIDSQAAWSADGSLTAIMSNAGKFLTQFGRAKDGATGVEYALILAIVCCGIAVSASMFADSVIEAVTRLAACIEQPSKCIFLS